MRHCKTCVPRPGILCLTFILPLMLAACHPARETPTFSDQYLLRQSVSVPGISGELTSEAILQADYFTTRSGKRDRLHVTPKWFSIDPPHGSGLDTAAASDYMLEDDIFNTLLDWMFAGTTLHLDEAGGIQRIEPGDEDAHAQIMSRMPDNLGALYEQAPMLMRLPDDITRGQYWEETRNMGDGTPLTLTIRVLDVDEDEVLLSLTAGDLAAALTSDTPELPLASGRMILRRDGDWPVELRMHMYLPPEQDSGVEEPISYAIRLASTTFSRFGFHDQDTVPEPDWTRQRLETPTYRVPDDREMGWLEAATSTDADALQALKKSTYWVRDGDTIHLHSDPQPLFGYHPPMMTLRAARMLDRDGAPIPVDTLLDRRFEQHFYSNDIWLRGHGAPLIMPDPRTLPDLASTLGRVELDLDIAVMQPAPLIHLDHGANADSVPGLAEARWHDQGVDLAIAGYRTLIALPLDEDGNVIPFDIVYLPNWMLPQLDPAQHPVMEQAGMFDPDVAALVLDSSSHEVRLRTETPATRIALYIGKADIQRHTLVYRDGNDPDPETSGIRRYSRPASGLASASLPASEAELDMAARVAALAPTCTECDTFRLEWPADTPIAVARLCALHPDEQARYYGNPLAGYLSSTRSYSRDGAPVTELRTADNVIRHFHDLMVDVTLRCPAGVTYVTETVEDSPCVTAQGRSALHVADTSECAALRKSLHAFTLDGMDAQDRLQDGLNGFEALDDLGFPLQALAPEEANEASTVLRFQGPISHVRYPRPEGEVTRQWSLHFPSLPSAESLSKQEEQ